MTDERLLPLMRLGATGATEVCLGLLTGAAGYRRIVVLKRVRAGREEADRARDALVWEAHVGAALNHPNVVHVYDLVEAQGLLTLVMEYVSGISLQGLIDHLDATGGTLPWPLATRFIADAARGLSHVHRAVSDDGRPLRVVHRDISPKNLLVAEEGHTKVADFGIARYSTRPDTAPAVVKGTLGYFSPEHARGAAIDWRSDVFSLGVVLWELLAARPLFRRNSAGETIDALLREPIPALPGEVPADVRGIAQQMLVRDPEHRRMTMRHVAGALDGAASSQGGSHEDVATFLRAECGEVLERRRQRLRQLVSSGTAAQGPTDPERSTVTLIEAGLDQQQPSFPDFREEETSDTQVDPSRDSGS